MTRTIYFTVATAGHVDHGKTSVLRALTGIDPDRLKEEKLRQMTTDLGFAHLTVTAQNGDEMIVGFIDVPGHGKFLKNMLAGVGGIDMALLVVAADEGPMPQTTAHTKILSLLGVTRALVVLTKTDVADQAMQAKSLERVDALLSKYCLENLGVVKVACPQKQGFDELSNRLSELLAQNIRPAAGATTNGASIYLPIDRVFTKAGYGLVVTGTLVRGTVKVGDSVFIQPGKVKARVRGLETFGRTLDHADAGQRLAVNLAIKEHIDLARGQAILGEELLTTSTLIIGFAPQSDSSDKNLDQVLPGQAVRLYHGTAEALGHVRWADVQEQSLVGQVSLDDSIVAEPGDRVVLRYGDSGITGGVVLCTARPRWLTRPKLMDLLSMLSIQDYVKAVALFLDACPQRAVRAEVIDSILPRDARHSILSQLVADGSIVRLAEHLATKESIDHLQTKLSLELSKSVAGEEPGVSAETVRAKILPGIDRAVFQALVKLLSDRAGLIRRGDKLLLPGAETKANTKSDEQQALESKILDTLSQYYCLEIEELVKQSGCDHKKISSALTLLSKEKKVAIVAAEFVGLTAKINDAHKHLGEIWRAKKNISPADFRDALGTTRKYAMALLSYFDDQGVTRFSNNSRVLLKTAKVD